MLISDLISVMKRLQASLLLENVHLHNKSVHSPSTFLMTVGQLLVYVSEPLIYLLDLFYVRKLVAILLLYVFEKILES